VTGYGLDGWGLIPGKGKIFLFSTASRPALGHTRSPTQWVSEALSSGIKRPGHKADQSLPSSAEVKNDEAIILLLHMSSWHGA
jgi:hypothetical protein